MKYALIILFLLLPTPAFALFNRTVINQYGSAPGYSTYSYSAPRYRSYRVRTFSAPVIQVAPAYVAPAPVVEAPQEPVVVRSVVVGDSPVVVKSKHREKHTRHGKHKSKHSETSR